MLLYRVFGHIDSLVERV